MYTIAVVIEYNRVIQTLTTVGYGDMPIYTTEEHILAITLMIFGVGFYSYTIGNLSSIFSNVDSRQSKLNVHIYIYIL